MISARLLLEKLNPGGRLATLVSLAGALVLTAGSPAVGATILCHASGAETTTIVLSGAAAVAGHQATHATGDSDSDGICPDDVRAGKVTICHVPPGNPNNAQTITIGLPAVEDHLSKGHGGSLLDFIGKCECMQRDNVSEVCPDFGGPCSAPTSCEAGRCVYTPTGRGEECRPSAGICDTVDRCDGTSLTCPADVKEDTSVVCRASAGICDLADHCDGTNDACPADEKEDASVVCRPSGGICDVADYCDGTNDACPADEKEDASVVCRPSGGICDVADYCDGTGDACPADEKQGADVVCRASQGECDLVERCTGGSSTCPADAKRPDGYPCVGDGNPCSLDQCDGSNDTCQHPAGNPGATCRAAAGICDVAEVCSGTSTACPSDGYAGTAITCRPPTGPCDVAETCSGSAVTCPADTRQPNQTPCPDDGNPCTADVCNGTSAACQHPTGNVGAVCRAATGTCDLVETCTGSDATCPGDRRRAAGFVCRARAGDCDVAEVCAGTSGACPADGFLSNATTCRPAAGACDIAEQCTGTSPACPANTFRPEGTACTDSNPDTTNDACHAGVCSGTGRVGDDSFTSGACGDSWCDVTESATTCPADCFASCAGAASLCGRRYDEVLVAGTHNANVSTGYPGYISLISAFNSNQDRTLTSQLNHGIRHMDLDMDYCLANATTGPACMCHGDDTCFIGVAFASDLLGEIRDWLDANPSEVLTLNFEEYLSDADFEQVLRNAGLDDDAYVIPGKHCSSNFASCASAASDCPAGDTCDYTNKICNSTGGSCDTDADCPTGETCSTGDPWPYTLNNMAARGKRLVIFAKNYGGSADWILGSSNIFKTDFGIDLYDEWPCSNDKDDDANGTLPSARQRYGLEHVRSGIFGQGDYAAATCANATQNIRNHYDKCATRTGRRVNFFVVDYYDRNVGALTVPDDVNGVDALTPVGSASDGAGCDCHNDEDCLSDQYCSAANTVAAIFGSCRDKESNGDSCLYDVECQSDICNAGFCRADGSINAGLPCSDDRACTSHECTNGFCQLVCGDGVCDPLEFCGIDRLGSCQADCGVCANGDLCQSNRDCTSNNCVLFVCANPYCGDLECNGTETCNPHGSNYCFFDCGTCPTCGDGHCDFPETCRSTVLDTGCCDCGRCTIFDAKCS